MQRGFTLIEALVALAIIGIVIAMIAAGVNQEDVVCKAGYQFVVVDPANGELRQLLDNEGKGIPCAKN